MANERGPEDLSAPSPWACPKCGEDVTHGSLMCGQCGTSLDWDDEDDDYLTDGGATVRCASCGSDIGLTSRYCSECGAEIVLSESDRQIALLHAEVSALQRRLDALSLPSTDLLSDRFWTRAAAVFGHGLAFNLILWVVVYLILFAVIGAASIS